MEFVPSEESCLLPMLILIGSFSLLAASTSWRRTSITPSLCLLVSMVSHSDCAAGDLVGKTIKQVIEPWKKNEVMHSSAALTTGATAPAVCSEHSQYNHKRTTWTCLSARLRDRGPTGWGVVTSLWDSSQENVEISRGNFRNVLDPPQTEQSDPYKC